MVESDLLFCLDILWELTLDGVSGTSELDAVRSRLDKFRDFARIAVDKTGCLDGVVWLFVGCPFGYRCDGYSFFLPDLVMLEGLSLSDFFSAVSSVFVGPYPRRLISIWAKRSSKLGDKFCVDISPLASASKCLPLEYAYHIPKKTTVDQDPYNMGLFCVDKLVVTLLYPDIIDLN